MTSDPTTPPDRVQSEGQELVDAFDAAFWSDPGAGWDRLREAAPVHRVRTPDGPPAWLVTRYADVRAGLLDARLSVARSAARGEDYKGFDLPAQLEGHLLNRDGADHARLRRLVQPALSVHRIERLGEEITRTCEQLLHGAAGRSSTSAHVDLVQALAIPLPLAVIGHLLALPQPVRDRLEAWTRQLLDPRPASAPRARDELGAMAAAVQEVIRLRRLSPGDDVISQLIAARDDADGGRLSAGELSAMIFYLLFVWLEVSIDLLANGLLTLLREPGRLGVLRERPQLVAGAVEELLRFEAPQSLASPRFPLVDVVIGGQPIAAGDTVLLCLSSANRDPRAVDRPEVFDLQRAGAAHVSLGEGLHRCLGAPLVRLQTQIAIKTLLSLFDEVSLEVAPQTLRWREGLRHRGVRELPVRLRAASQAGT